MRTENTDGRVAGLTLVWLLAGALLAGCGGDAEPAATQPEASPSPVASTATVEAATPTPSSTPDPTTAPTPTTTPPPTLTATPEPATATPPPSTPEPTLTFTSAAEREAYERLSTLVPWMRESLSALRIQATEIAIELWLEDAALAEPLVLSQWFQDGIAGGDLETIQLFAALASRNPSIALKVASSSWFSDIVTDDERLLLDRLGPDRPSPSFLADEPEYVGVLTDDLARFFLHAHDYLRGGDLGEVIFNGSWFADGLSPLEMAFVVAVSAPSSPNLPLYRDLLRESYAATRTTSLPLAGEVSLYLFQNTPIPDAAYILDRMEATARALEELLDVPFPTSDIILVVGDGAAVDYPVYRAGHYSTHMHLNRLGGDVMSIAHEVAHYYFFGETPWFVEGAAELIELYVDDAVDTSVYAPREDAPPHHASSCLMDENAQNVRHFFLLQDEGGVTIGDSCRYSLGERLLVHLYDSIGEEALGLAFRSWYLQENTPLKRIVNRRVRLDETVSNPNPERVVFDALSKGIPDYARERFDRVYLEFHGGVGGGPDDGIPDDFGDGKESAVRISPDDTVAGSLDHSFDFDYFRFTAIAGQKYELDFDHGTPTSRVAIYDYHPSLVYDENGFYERVGHPLTRITPLTRYVARHRLWVAPRSDDFYIAVQNFGGAPGPYAFHLATREAVPDDHGDNMASATTIAFGEAAPGTLNDDSDFDYFWFEPVEGQLYRIEVVSGTGLAFILRLFNHEGHNAGYPTRQGFQVYGDDGLLVFRWRARFSEEHYVAISAANEVNLGYALTITEEES